MASLCNILIYRTLSHTTARCEQAHPPPRRDGPALLAPFSSCTARRTYTRANHHRPSVHPINMLRLFWLQIKSFAAWPALSLLVKSRIEHLGAIRANPVLPQFLPNGRLISSGSSDSSQWQTGGPGRQLG